MVFFCCKNLTLKYHYVRTAVLSLTFPRGGAIGAVEARHTMQNRAAVAAIVT